MSDSGKPELTEDEAMAGRIVWVCENGHIDHGHKTKGNHLDLCSRCKEGVCVPQKTLGRRSKAQRQRDRDLGIATKRRPRGGQRRQPIADPAVTIKKPGQEQVVVDADSLRHDPEPPFELVKADREAIVAGKTPRISLPREAPADHPEHRPYPAAVGDVVGVAANLVIAVCGLRVLFDEIVVQYEVRDARVPAGDNARLGTTKAVERPQERMGGPELRSEREPERLPRRETNKIAARVHEAELKKLRRTREDLGHHLKDQADAPRDVRFHLQKSIEAIDRRVENIEDDMTEAA